MGINPCTKRNDENENKRNYDDLHDNPEIENRLIEEPILDVINQFTPKGILTELKYFRKRYKIKKNLKCQKDLIYNIKVIENIRSERLFNAKIIKRNDVMQMGLDAFKNFYETEMKILSHVQHPNVESITEVFFDQNRDNFIIVIVCTYTSKNSLLDLINNKINKHKKFEHDEIVTIIKILIETVYKLKARCVIHRNLSPESIFFQRENNFQSLCIRNFYCSTMLVNNASNIKGVTGPLWYMAPEILRDQPYDYKSDIWSLGMIFYMLITLENPFQEANNKDQMLEYLKSEKFFKSEKELKNLNVNPEAILMLYKMLKDDPSNRADVEVLINDQLIKSKHKLMENNPFNSFIILDKVATKVLQFKLQNCPELHDLIFYFIYFLKDYFLDLDELFLLNEFYKYLDTNNDGIVEFDEIVNILKCDKYKEEDYINYTGILKAILNSHFRLSRIEEHLFDSFDYDYFLTANIILNIFKCEDKVTFERIKIMFKELDDDGGGTISLEELEAHFTTKFSDKKITDILDKISENKLYTKDKGKMIKDFYDLTESDFTRLIKLEVVELSPYQTNQIKLMEAKENKGGNETNNRSMTTSKSRLVTSKRE
jgi:serine/threonine protein kinase